MNPIYDPILGKLRAEDSAGGSGGGGGTDYVGGYRITIAGGTISNDRYMPIESVSGNSVTMQAGHAYKLYATTSAVTINTETIPANSFGLEGHLEIFVGSTGYIVTGTNVVLANALEPNAVNNCTVRFHDGFAIISVEDNVAGYIVTVGSGTSAGTLPYALASAGSQYVAFDARLNGQTLDMAGAVTNGEKHVIGNGYTETIVSGGINCTSKTTFTNLTFSGSAVTSGALEFANGVYHAESVTGAGSLTIGSGSIIDLTGNSNTTPIAPGGGITFESGGATVKVGNSMASSSYMMDNVTLPAGAKLTNTAVVNLGGGHVYVSSGNIIGASGCTFTSGTAQYGGAFQLTGSVVLSDCVISGNNATNNGGGVYVGSSGVFSATSCTISGNAHGSGYLGHDIFTRYGSTVLSDCTIGEATTGDGNIYIGGVCSFTKINTASNLSGSVIISAGANITLTSSIAPGGSITFASGGATVVCNAGGSVSSCFIAGANPNAVRNDCSVDFTNERYINTTWSFEGVNIRQSNFFFLKSNGVINLKNARVSCVITRDGATNVGRVSMDGNIFIGVNIQNISQIQILEGATVHLTDTLGFLAADTVSIGSGAVLDLASVTQTSTVRATNGVIVADGGCQVITSAGSTVSIVGGTYTKIKNDGTTE